MERRKFVVVTDKPRYVRSAEALFDRWSDLGVPATSERRILVIDRIKREYQAGLWLLRRKLWVTATHAEGAAYVDWISPYSALAVPNGTYTFVEDSHWVSDGSTGFIDTNWNPATDGGGIFTLNSAHLAITVANAVSDTNFDAGTGATLRIIGRSGTTGSMRINSGTTTGIPTVASSVGRLVGLRRDSSNQLGAKDGVAPTSASATSTSVGSADLMIGGNITSTFSVREIQEVSAGAAFSDQNLVDDYTISSAWVA